jgi:hypothetical protein
METNAIKTTPWNGVERTNEAGHFSLRVTFPERPVGTRVPIFTNGPPEAPNVLFAEYREDESILFEYRASDPEFTRRYIPYPIDFGKEYELDVAADWRIELLTARLDDRVVIDSRYTYRGDDFELGRNEHFDRVEATFPGRLVNEPVDTPLCDALVRDAARAQGSTEPDA